MKDLNKATLMVNNQLLQIKEYDGQRVVTLKDIDTVHNRPNGTARKRFNDNRTHFIQGEDYYKVCASEIRTNKIMSISPKTHQDVVLITETGYLMLVKSFTDDLAWTVQRELVNSYFRQKPTVQNEPTYFDKFWNGEKVITIKDFEYFTGISQATVNYYVNNSLKKNDEYYLLEGTELQQFKYLNTRCNKKLPHLILLNYKGCIKLAQILNCKADNIECFKNASCMALPEKKEDNKPYYVTVSKDLSAYNKLSELKNMATALSSMLDLIGKSDTPIKKFVPYLETLQYMTFDLGIEVTKFYKMVDVKDWI